MSRRRIRQRPSHREPVHDAESSFQEAGDSGREPSAARHRDWTPRWLIVTVFLAIEVVLIVVMYDSWRYRTVIGKARQAMTEERFDDALRYWEKHAKNYPGAEITIPYRRDRATSRAGAGDYQGAIDDIEFMFEKDETLSRNPELLALQAKCQVAIGDRAKALKTYETLLRIDPGNTVANVYIGRLLLNEGKVLEAARQFQAIPVENYPEDLKEEWSGIEKRFLEEADSQVEPTATSPTETVSEPSEPATTPSP